MTVNQKRPGLTAAETAFCKEIVRAAQAHAIGFGRTAFLFGHMTSMLVEHAVDVQDADPCDALQAYIERFMNGLGGVAVDVEFEAEATKRSH